MLVDIASQLSETERAERYCISLLGLLYQSTTNCVAYTAETHCLTVLKAEEQGEVWDEGWFLLRAVRKKLVHASFLASGSLLAIFGVPQFVKASFQSLPSSSHGVFLGMCYSCVQIFLLLYQSEWIMAHHFDDFILNLITSVKIPSPKNVTFWGSGIRAAKHLFWEGVEKVTIQLMINRN